MFSRGTRTLSKKVWQNSDSPLSSWMGVVDTPGEAMSISMKLMPACLGPLVSVRTRAKIQSAWSRSEEHTSELQSRGHLVCRLLLEKTNRELERPRRYCNRWSG